MVILATTKVPVLVLNLASVSTILMDKKLVPNHFSFSFKTQAMDVSMDSESEVTKYSQIHRINGLFYWQMQRTCID